MNELRKFLSAIVSLITWVVVGVAASEYVPTPWAVGIGFISFVIVAALIYPKEKSRNDSREWHR
jgi:hypothetical protein